MARAQLFGPLYSKSNPVPRSLRSRSKYDPHQSIRERMRRVGQLLRNGLPVDDLAQYIDYSTTKAAKGDLTRFRLVRGPVADVTFAEPIGLIGDDTDGLLDVRFEDEEVQ